MSISPFPFCPFPLFAISPLFFKVFMPVREKVGVAVGVPQLLVGMNMLMH